MYIKTGLTPVKNQGTTQQCAVYACMSVVEWYYKKKKRVLNLTENEVYRMVKEIDDSDSAGTFPLDVIKVLYRLKKIRYYGALPFDIYKINQAIDSEDSGVVGAILLYDGYKESKTTGILPLPSKKRVGWHTMHFVGYDSVLRQFICKNSWGEEWGQKGYLLVPYEYIKNNAQMFYSINFK